MVEANILLLNNVDEGSKTKCGLPILATGEPTY